MPLIQTWTRNYHILRNRTWSGGRSSWQPSPEVPEIYPIVASMVAWMTDSPPSFDCVPTAIPHSSFFEQLVGMATDLEAVMKAVWDEEDYAAEVEKMLWDGFCYGLGLLKTTWDVTLHGGLGNPVMRRVDPYTWYPDPNATNFDNMQYCIEAKVLSAQELETKFPGSLAKVGTNGMGGDADQSPTILSPSTQGRRPLANPGVLPNYNSAFGQIGTGSGTPNARFGLPGQTNRVSPTSDPGFLVLEAWLRTPVTQGDSRSDTWRCVVVTGDTVLFDEVALRMWAHGRHPYSRWVPHDVGEMYGISLVELLAPTQISINRILAATEQNIWLTGNPVLKATTGSNLSRATVTNRPGQRLDIGQNPESVQWMTPPPSDPQQASALIQFYINEMDRISGLSGIVRGLTPTGRNAEGVIDSVSEAAFVRMRMGIRNLERTQRDAGNLVASLIAEFYDSPRLVPILGADGAKQMLPLHNQHFYLPSGDSQMPMMFSISVQGNSTLPTSKSALANLAMALFGLGAIDVEALLSAVDWPGWINVAQRVQQQQMVAGTMGQPPTQRAAARR